tara:strand:- start:28145 stop:28342 length:198 start_codon:yes stop_codon:yes gene_type:complete
MSDQKQYKAGDPVTNPKHGAGRVHLVTNDKDFPVAVKFNQYPVVNYYYSQDGAGLDSASGDIQRT